MPTLLENQQYVAGRFRRMVNWGAHIRGHKSVPDHHWVMADFLEGTKPKWVNRAKVILGARFLAKSWLGLRQYLKWRWLRCPWMQVIVHSSNDKMAQRFVLAIKDELRYDELTRHFWPSNPNISNFEFSLDGIQHEQGQSIVAAGIKTSMVGSRCDLYAFDDPEPDTDPESMHQRILDAIGEAGDILHEPGRHLGKMGLEALPSPEVTQLLVLGQPHCVNTAYIPRPEDFEEGAEGHPLVDAVCLRIPAVIDGEPMDSAESWRWKAMMARKYFDYEKGRPKTPQEVARTMPTSRWQLQHQINTAYAIQAGPVLRLKEIEQVMTRPSRLIAIVDPADSEEGCEWAVVVMGLMANKIHIEYLTGLQGEAYEGGDWEAMGESVWRQIFDITAHYGVREMFLEKNLKSASSACRRYIAKNEVHCVVTEFMERANKKLRIPEVLEPLVNNRMVSCHPQVLQDQRTVLQLARLRWDRLPKPNDRIDVLAKGAAILVEEPHLWALRTDPGHVMPAIRGRPAASLARVQSIRGPFERIQTGAHRWVS